MHRIMQSAGSAEGLRGLIDSSLLKSLKKVMEHRDLFGPSVLSVGACLECALFFPNNVVSSNQHDGNIRPQ
jgi:hypothetical protein